MARTRGRPTIEEIDAAIEAIRARADKEIATLEQKKTHVQASHFQRITRVARDAGCDLANVSDVELMAALKALAAPFRGADARPAATPQRDHPTAEGEAAHGKRRST